MNEQINQKKICTGRNKWKYFSALEAEKPGMEFE